MKSQWATSHLRALILVYFPCTGLVLPRLALVLTHCFNAREELQASQWPCSHLWPATHVVGLTDGRGKSQEVACRVPLESHFEEQLWKQLTKPLVHILTVMQEKHEGYLADFPPCGLKCQTSVSYRNVSIRGLLRGLKCYFPNVFSLLIVCPKPRTTAHSSTAIKLYRLKILEWVSSSLVVLVNEENKRTIASILGKQ